MTEVVFSGPIVLATSPPDARRRIAESLRRAFGVSAVHAAKDRRDFEPLVVEHQPAIVLLGVPLRGYAALEGLRAIRALSPASRTIVMTEISAEVVAVDALKLGARGYCSANIDPVVLRKAIDLVHQGEIWIGRKVMLRLLEDVARTNAEAPRSEVEPGCLTVREQQIADLIGGGASNKEIAEALMITEKTVKAHLTSVFRKLGVASRLQLAVHGTKVLQTQAQ